MLRDSVSTIVILKGIIDTLSANPESCSFYSAEDIKSCLYADIQDCRIILPPEVLSESLDLADYYSISLYKALLDSNIVSATSVLSDMIALLESLPDKKIVEDINFNSYKDYHLQNNTAIVFGDSHVNVFSGNEHPTFSAIGKRINVCPNTDDRPFTAIHFGPCLAYTSCNYNSSNCFLEKYEYIADNFVLKDDKIIVSLGEIDMRAHVFKETSKQNCSYKKVISDIFNNYSSFLLKAHESFSNLYVWGPIATQKDYHHNDHAMLPRYGTEQERNLATKEFSHLLSDFCNEHGIGYFSIFDQMVDENLLTNEQLFCDDHWHLGQKAYPIILKLWNSIN